MLGLGFCGLWDGWVVLVLYGDNYVVFGVECCVVVFDLCFYCEVVGVIGYYLLFGIWFGCFWCENFGCGIYVVGKLNVFVCFGYFVVWFNGSGCRYQVNVVVVFGFNFVVWIGCSGFCFKLGFDFGCGFVIVIDLGYCKFGNYFDLGNLVVYYQVFIGG